MALSAEQTATQVANLALAHCGVSKPIANLATEKSLEAQACRSFMDISRQDVLREFGWFFAVKQLTPALVANQPTPEWLYAYQYPQDALKLERFVSWRLNNDTRQSRIPYALKQPVPVNLSTLTTPPTSYAESSGLWIYTNWPGINGATLPVILEYVFDNTNVAQWTPDFVMAMSLKLATLIVSMVTTGDPQGTKAKIEQDYVEAISKAKTANLNEEQRPQEPQSEFIRARAGESYGYPGSSWIAEPAGFVVE